MIDGKNIFNRPGENKKITFENIRKIATSQGDDYTTGCLLGYLYFKENYKMKIKKVKGRNLMLILEQLNRLILLQIWIVKKEKYKNLFDS